MNINGLARTYIARHKSGEEFLKHVVGIIERQLKEWDDRYEVIVMQLVNYEMFVTNEEQYYHVTIPEQEVHLFQKSGPFILDRKIWRELKKQGLPIVKGDGNYIDVVL